MRPDSGLIPRLSSWSALRSWLPWLLPALLLALVLSVWFVVRRSEKRRIGDRIGAEVDKVTERITRRMAAHVQILRGASKLVSLRPAEATREEWKEYVASLELDRLNPGFQAMGYAEWVPEGQLEAHVRRLQAEGFPDYAVRPGGSLPPDGGVSSIIFIEPFDERNQRALFKDMLAEPVRRAALHRSRDTGSVTLSGRVKLYQEKETEVQAGTLLFAPAYRRGMPLGTVAQRQAALLGWTYLAFRMQNLMDAVVEESDLLLNMELFDGDSLRKEDLLFVASDGSPSRQEAWTNRRSFEVAGRLWTLVASPRADFVASYRGRSQLVVLARAERRAVAIAADRKERLPVLLDSVPDLVFFKDREGVYRGCNLAFAEFVGCPREEIVGRTDHNLFGREVAESFREHDELMLRELRPRHNEEWISYPDGRRTLVETLKTPYHGPSGEVRGILGISRDITDRRRPRRPTARARSASPARWTRRERASGTGTFGRGG